MRSLLLDALALLVYPGLLTAAAGGLLAEAALARLSGVRVRLRQLAVRPPATAVAAAAAGALAAAQLAAPFSPLDAIDRNVLVALGCGAAVAWLGWAWGPGESGAAVLAGIAGWAVALLAPAVLAQDVHPQVLAGLSLTSARPAKVLAAVLYVASLPALLGAERGAAAQRLWLWLPAGGLFASVFTPAAPDDLAGLARFFGAAALVVAAALALARAILGRRAYPAVLAVLTLATAGLTAAASFLQ